MQMPFNLLNFSLQNFKHISKNLLCRFSCVTYYFIYESVEIIGCMHIFYKLVYSGLLNTQKPDYGIGQGQKINLAENSYQAQPCSVYRKKTDSINWLV